MRRACWFLITSAAFSVTLNVWQQRWLRSAFILITVIFTYTTADNIYERPEGLKISSIFILTTIVTSFVSRAVRSTELRITKVELSPQAAEFLAEDRGQPIRLIAHSPRAYTDGPLRSKCGTACLFSRSRANRCVSVRADALSRRPHGRQASALYAKSPVVANSNAAILIHLEKKTRHIPHAYFKMERGKPVANIMRYIFLGGRRRADSP